MDSQKQQSGGVANVSDLNQAVQQTLIHIELTQTFYSVTPAEFTILEEGTSSIWKDITLSGFGLGLPCCINAIIEFLKDSKLSAEVFWNSLIGGICIILAIIFGIMWRISTNKCSELINEIKKRPKYKMQ